MGARQYIPHKEALKGSVSDGANNVANGTGMMENTGGMAIKNLALQIFRTYIVVQRYILMQRYCWKRKKMGVTAEW